MNLKPALQGAPLPRRNPTRSVSIGKVTVGSSHPIAVQSMTATKTADVEATVASPSSRRTESGRADSRRTKTNRTDTRSSPVGVPR